jgi:hypothetical protein
LLYFMSMLTGGMHFMTFDAFFCVLLNKNREKPT